jgi:hypothetical protein
MYARNAEVACLVFDQANAPSFESLKKGGNKSDLDSVVLIDEVSEFCNELRLPLRTTSVD